MKKLSILSILVLALACCLLTACGSTEVPLKDIEADLSFFAQDKLDITLNEVSVIKQTADKDGRELVVECLAVGEIDITRVDARFRLNYVKADKGWKAITIQPVDQKNWAYLPLAPIDEDALKSILLMTVNTPYGTVNTFVDTIEAVTIKSHTWDEKNPGTKDTITAELVLSNRIAATTVEAVINLEFRPVLSGKTEWACAPVVIEAPDAELTYLPGREPPTLEAIDAPSLLARTFGHAYPFNSNFSDIQLVSTDAQAVGPTTGPDFGSYYSYEVRAHAGTDLVNGVISATFTYRHFANGWVYYDAEPRIESINADALKGVWVSEHPFDPILGVPLHSSFDIRQVRTDGAAREVHLQGIVTSERVDGSEKGAYSFTAAFQTAFSNEFSLENLEVIDGDDMRRYPDYSSGYLRFDYDEGVMKTRGGMRFEKN